MYIRLMSTSSGILKATKYNNPIIDPGLGTTISDKKEYIAINNDIVSSNKLLVGKKKIPLAKFYQSVSDQKDESKVCASGKKADIDRNKLSFIQFIKAIGLNNGKNKLGCGDYNPPYVTYENGKYCCSDKSITDQEYFDYINELLNGAMANVDDTMFKNNIQYIRLFITERKRLLEKDPELVDTIILPVNVNEFVNGEYNNYSSIEEWFDSSIKRTEDLDKMDRPDYDPEPGIPDDVDKEFDNIQVELASYNYDKFKNPSYTLPRVGPFSRGLLQPQKAMKNIIGVNSEQQEESSVNSDVKEQPVARSAPPARGLKRGGKSIKRNRKRNNSKKGGSRKKRTTRNNRK
jgi:hypothetical protein